MKKILLFLLLPIVLSAQQYETINSRIAAIPGKIRDSLNNRLGANWVTPQMLGVVNDGVSDASASINQALANAVSEGVTYGEDITLYIPNGIYRLDNPIVLQTTTGYRSVNIIGQSALNTRFYYYGSADTSAFYLSRVSRFKMSNLSIYNYTTGNPQTTGAATGIRVLGNTAGGADNVIGVFENIAIQGFEYGIRLGSTTYPAANAAEEMTYLNIDISYCKTGVQIEGDNSLNHTFINPNIVWSGTGIRTVEANSVNVFGGSFSHDSIACMQFIYPGSFNIIGTRGETSPKFIVTGYQEYAGGSTPTTMVIQGNKFRNIETSGTYAMTDSVAIHIGKAGLYTIMNNTLSGLVEIATGIGVTSTVTLKNNAVSQDTLYRIQNNNIAGNYNVRVISEGNTNTSALSRGEFFPYEKILFNGVKTNENNSELQNGGFFSHNPFGANRLYNPNLENLLFSSTSRFTISDTSFQTITEWRLFDGQYAQYATIDSADTAVIYINFTDKSEFDANGVTYTKGSILLHFYYTNIPASVYGDIYIVGSGWVALQTPTNISTDERYAIWKLTVPDRTYGTQIRLYVVARDTMDALLTEIEYYPERQSGDEYLSNVNKYGKNSFYNTASWKNGSNEITASIDSLGAAVFKSLLVNNVDVDSLQKVVYGLGITDVTSTSSSIPVFNYSAITISEVRAVITSDGGGDDTTSFNVCWGTSIASASYTLFSTDQKATNVTTGHYYNTFNDATIPANVWVWLRTTTESGTVNTLAVTLKGKND